MESYQRLLAMAPEPRAVVARDGAVERTVRAAVAQLPMTDRPQAWMQLERILEGVLASGWSAGERIGALECVRAAVVELDSALVDALATQPSRLPAATPELAQELQRRLAQGYLVGLCELCAPAGRVPVFRGRLAATAAVRGIAHFSQVLLWAARSRKSPPAGVWQSVHALHRFAGAQGFAMQEVEDPRAAGAAITAHAAYAHLLLFALANPYRFAAAELRVVWQACRSMADHCVLAQGAGAGIAVDQHSDAGPGCATRERLQAGAGMLAINVAAVEHALEQALARLPAYAQVVPLAHASGAGLDIDSKLLRRMRRGWVSEARRRSRLPAGHRLDIVVGMRAVHQALAGDADVAAFVRQIRADAVGNDWRRRASARSIAPPAMEPWPLRADVIDQSGSGYRMRLLLAAGMRVRVGDVVGLAPAGEDLERRDWMVGVVRWLTPAEPESKPEDASLSLGIELLRREARAAGVCAMTADGGALTPQYAVELPGGDAVDRLSILVPYPFGSNVVAAEVALPALNSDWDSRPMVATWRPDATEALGPSCYRVTLVRDAQARAG